MGHVLDFLGEEIGGIDGSRDVLDFDRAAVMGFTHLVLAKVEVLDALACDSGGPINCASVVIEYRDSVGGVIHGQVLRSVNEAKEVNNTFIGSNNLGLTGAESGLILANGTPSNGTTTSTYDEAAERTEFEHFNGGSAGNGLAKLSSPASIAVGSELLAF